MLSILTMLAPILLMALCEDSRRVGVARVATGACSVHWPPLAHTCGTQFKIKQLSKFFSNIHPRPISVLWSESRQIVTLSQLLACSTRVLPFDVFTSFTKAFIYDL